MTPSGHASDCATDYLPHSSCCARPSCCELLQRWAGWGGGGRSVALPATYVTHMCSIGDISGDLASQDSLHISVSESRRQHVYIVDVRCRPGTRSFHQCWANGTPLDVKFDQCNVGRLSYLIRTLIPSFGRM